MDDLLDEVSDGERRDRRRGPSEDEDLESVVDSAARTRPAVKLVNLIICEALKEKASDIHIEPFEKRVRVRYRVDGAWTRSWSRRRRSRTPDLAPQDHGRSSTSPRAHAAGRQVPDQARGPQDRLPRLDPAGRPRREDRDAHPRRRQPGAQARRRSASSRKALERLPEGDRRALRDDPGHRPDGLGQVDDALLVRARRSRRRRINFVTVEDPVEYRSTASTRCRSTRSAG